MREGDVVGREFMGEVAEVGPEVNDTRVGVRSRYVPGGGAASVF